MPALRRASTLVYESGQASSLIAIVLFATISLLALFAVFVRYSWDPLVAIMKRRSSGNQHHSRAFFHTQLGAYIASLMLSNALSSISMMINAQWASAKVVTEGNLCNTQGILSQIGDTGGAYFTCTIAIHAFNTLVLRNKLPRWICLAATAIGWLVAILMAATPTWIRNSPFGPVYGINELSCGISTSFPVLNTMLHLLPLLLGSIVSVVFFTLVFLVLRGTLIIKNGIRLNLDRSHRWSMSSVTTAEYQRFIAAVGRSMLWYPFAYNILLLPEIIVSLTKASGLRVPFGASVFAITTASMLGTANALILVNTLRILRPFLEGNLSVGGNSINSTEKKVREADMESFFAGTKSPMALAFLASPTKSPKTPEKALVPRRESKREWTPPQRTVSKPAESIGSTVARNISRMSRNMSIKRKEPRANPMVESQNVVRPITPVAELNAMIAVPEPVAVRKPTLPATPRLPGASPGLPAPRRDTRSPLIRQPTLPPKESSPTEAEAPFTAVTLNTPEPPEKDTPRAVPTMKVESEGGSRHTSASDSLLSMYLSRSPEQSEMAKPAPPPKPLPPKPRPAPMPLSARPPMSQNSLAPSPLPTLRSARMPVNYALNKDAFANNEWAERIRRNASMTTPMTATMSVKAERRRSRSLDLNAGTMQPRTPAQALGTARTPVYGSTLDVRTPGARDGSLSALSTRTPTSARRLPPTPSRSGSLTPGGNYL